MEERAESTELEIPEAAEEAEAPIAPKMVEKPVVVGKVLPAESVAVPTSADVETGVWEASDPELELPVAEALAEARAELKMGTAEGEPPAKLEQ